MTKISFVLLASLVSISAVLSLPVPSDPAPAQPNFNHGDVVAVKPKNFLDDQKKTFRHPAVVVGGPNDAGVHDVASVSKNLPAAHYNPDHQAPAKDFHPGLEGNINTGKPDQIKQEHMVPHDKEGVAGVPVKPEKLKELQDTIAENCKRDGGCKVKVNSGVIKPAQKVGGMRVASKASPARNGKGK